MNRGTHRRDKCLVGLRRMIRGEFVLLWLRADDTMDASFAVCVSSCHFNVTHSKHWTLKTSESSSTL